MIYLLVVVVAVVIVGYLFYISPEGYEDEDGFHFGKK